MSETIDKKIVEMAFQNSQFEKNVGDSLGTIDKLKKSLNFSDAGKSFDQITAASSKVNLSSMADGIKSVSSHFSIMGIAAITTLSNIVTSAYQAGAKIVKALTIDPIALGFADYGSKLTSIQTITSATGKSIQEVAVYFNQLDDYADKTIFNLNDMTGALAKFTNAGVDLNVAVPAIKGIANMVALAGQDANAAGIAFYNLSQSIAGGFLTTTDFRSLNLANVATKEWKNQMIQGAIAAGTLKKTNDGLYQVNGVGKAIKEAALFTEELSTGWATTQVLIDVLGKYGDTTTDIGAKAQAAAQDVKSFSMMMETLKASVGTGWTDTFEILIGNLTEAKALFGPLTSFFQGIFDQITDARNNLLSGWKELGGRTAIIASLENVLNGVVSIIQPIKDGFKDIFPSVTAKQLYTLSLNIRRFTQNLILSGETADKVKHFFKGVFALFDIGKMAVGAIAKEFGRLLKALFPMADGLGGLLGKLADFIIKLRDSIKANDVFSKVMHSIGNAILVVGGIISKGISAIMTAVDRFKELNKSQGFLKSFSGAIGAFFNFFKNLDFSFLTGILDRIKERLSEFGKIGDFLKKAFSNMGKGKEKAANPYMELINTIKDNIIEALKKMVLNILDALANIDFKNFSFKKMFDTLNSGLLGGLLLSIITFVRKGNGLFGSIVDVFKGVAGFAENANGILASITTVMTGVKDILTAWQQQIRAGILLKIAGAVGILALSLIALSLVDSEKLTGALAAITGLFADLMGSLALYEKVAGGGVTGVSAMAKGIGAMVGLSVAVLILSGALVNLSTVPTEDLIKGIAAITTLTALLIATSIILSKNSKSVITGAGSIIIFSIALRSLIGPVKTLGEIDPENLTRGLTGLGVLMAELVVFMKFIGSSSSAIDDIIGIAILALAINDLGGIITKFAQQDTNALVKGLTVMAIILSELMAFTKLTAAGGINFMTTATGMLILAGAMFIIGEVLKKLSGMSWEELAIGLAGLGGSLAILAIALNAMTGGLPGAAAVLVSALALAVLVPPLIALSKLDIKQVGIVLLALVGVFTVFGLAGYVLTPVIPILLALAASIGIFGLAVLAAGLGIGAFAAGLALLAGVGAAAGAALGAVLLSIATVLPLLAIGLGLAIIAFARVIKDGAPVLFEAGKVLLLGLIKSVTETIPQIVEMILTGIDTFLASVSEKLPSIIQSGYTILLSFLNGMSNNIDSIVTVVADIITKFLNALAEKAPALVDSGWNFIISWIDGITKGVKEHLPELMTSVQNLGLEIIKGIIRGLLDGRENAINAIKDIGNMLIESFKERLGIHSPSSVFIALAGEIVTGLINGIKERIVAVKTEATNLANGISDAVKEKVDSMVKTGKDLVLGLAEGIKTYASEAITNAANLASEVLATIKAVFQSKSPSKATFNIGGDVDQGLANGIGAFAGRVMTSVQDLGKDTLSGFTSVVSKISDAVGNNLNATPTIRPVLDLSEIQNGSSKIDDILGNSKKLNMTVATLKAASVNASTNTINTDPTSGAQQTGNPSTIQFIQNNTSPKTLSPTEVYRQTKNLLSAKVKAVEGS